MIDASLPRPWTLERDTFLARYENANTRAAYRYDLNRWLEWCQAEGVDALAATRGEAQAFATWLTSGRGYRPASVLRHVQTLAIWYEILIEDEIAVRNPTRRLRLPKVHPDPTSKIWLDRWELGALMRACRTPHERILVSLMGIMGLRVTAAVEAQIADLGQAPSGHRTLRTVGKGSKPSTKAIPIQLWADLDAATAGRTSGPLVLSRLGRPITRHGAAWIVRRLADDAGIDRQISPHVLRRSFATNLLRAGVSPRVVQDGMDHADLRTTMRYDALGVELHAQGAHAMANLLASSI